MQKYLAIILASRNIGEFDRMYSIYTRESGLLRVIGKGVRKSTAKLAGHLEPGTFSEVYVARGKGIGQITSAITIESFEEIKSNFEKLGATLEIFRFFGMKFAEGEKDEKVFDLLKNFLEILDRAEKEYDRLISTEAFWWKLFDFLGHRPETLKCAKCDGELEEKKRKYFSVSQGGMICGHCLENDNAVLNISVSQIKLLRIFLANSLEKILKVRISKTEIAGLKRIRKDFGKYNF